MSRGELLLVEDDALLRDVLVRELEAAGYRVRSAADGGAGLRAVSERPCDLVLLDLNLPDMDGLQVAERMQDERIPVLMLTARSSVDDRIRGLYAGASDYLAKPFDVRELLARIHVQLQRGSAADGTLRYKELRYEPERRQLSGPDGERLLPEREGEVLRLLLAYPGRVFSPEDLEVRLYGSDLPASNTVQVYVSHLRRALREVGGGDPIRTVRGKGYTVA